MYKIMTKDLQDLIIDRLANASSNSNEACKVIAKDLNVDTAQVVKTLRCNRGRINGLRMQVLSQTPEGEYMVINEDKTKVVQQEITVEELQDINDKVTVTVSKKTIKEDRRLEIAEAIENSSKYYTFNDNSSSVREIPMDDLKNIAKKYNITVQTAERIAKEYDIRVEKQFRAVRTPYSIRKRSISKEVYESVRLDLKSTALAEHEIAELHDISLSSVNNYKRNNKIDRPNKEDESVKAKTKKRREELKRRKELKATENEKVENINPSQKQQEKLTTSMKDLVKDIEVPDTIPEEEKKSEIKPELVVEKKEDTKSMFPVSATKDDKKSISIIEILHNKSITKIAADTCVEAILVDGRHEMPRRKCIYESIGPDLMEDFDQMDKIAFDFVKQNIRFNEEGVADKWLKLYLTGYQKAYESVIKACMKLKVNLTCMHFNNKTNTYKESKFNDGKYVEIFPTYNSLGVGIAAISKTFGNNLYRFKCTVRDIEQNTNNLFIIFCEENTRSIEDRNTTAIICTSMDDYKEIYINIISTLISQKILGFNINVHKFNFNSRGEIIKNTVESKYELN